jgi:hypothetical protein
VDTLICWLTGYTQKQLEDPAFTYAHGIGGSVMDYNAINLALESEKQGDYVMPTIGPYDYWAIEYAYKPIDPDKEKSELAKIAARSDEPQLAFANDIDVIAMSTHGHKFIGDMIHGSVSHNVRHSSTIPVLLVRGNAKGRSGPHK